MVLSPRGLHEISARHRVDRFEGRSSHPFGFIAR
jgi:hypothetical protein